MNKLFKVSKGNTTLLLLKKMYKILSLFMLVLSILAVEPVGSRQELLFFGYKQYTDYLNDFA